MGIFVDDVYFGVFAFFFFFMVKGTSRTWRYFALMFSYSFSLVIRRKQLFDEFSTGRVFCYYETPDVLGAERNTRFCGLFWEKLGRTIAIASYKTETRTKRK